MVMRNLANAAVMGLTLFGAVKAVGSAATFLFGEDAPLTVGSAAFVLGTFFALLAFVTVRITRMADAEDAQEYRRERVEG
jgi:cation transporter-like permease